MERTYDIFEICDADAIWRDIVTGHEPALARMRELASDSPNEFRLMHLPSKAVIILYARDSFSVSDDRTKRERRDDDVNVSKKAGLTPWVETMLQLAPNVVNRNVLRASDSNGLPLNDASPSSYPPTTYFQPNKCSPLTRMV